jgi:hypothetical protein
MGYNLHITRSSLESDDREPIAATEWLRVVKEDSELRLAGYNGDFFVLWSGPSRYPDPWLDWDDGKIFSKNPDDPLIEKMIEIAGKLGAHVQGDDGEFYTWVDGKKSVLPSVKAVREAQSRPRRR